MADETDREEPEVEGHKKRRAFEDFPSEEGQTSYGGDGEDDEPEVEGHKKRK